MATENEPYRLDPTRIDLPETGIYVRATSSGAWDSIDIAHLDEDSLNRWLTSRGGSNPWAESVVRRILGHQG
jgi:hypothetical protein